MYQIYLVSLFITSCMYLMLYIWRSLSRTKLCHPYNYSGIFDTLEIVQLNMMTQYFFIINCSPLSPWTKPLYSYNHNDIFDTLEIISLTWWLNKFHRKMFTTFSRSVETVASHFMIFLHIPNHQVVHVNTLNSRHMYIFVTPILNR